MSAALHHSAEVQQSERQLRDLLASLVAEAAAAAVVRSDVPARELASFCVHALTAGADIESAAAVETLVDLVWAASARRPPPSGHAEAEGRPDRFHPVYRVRP